MSESSRPRSDTCPWYSLPDEVVVQIIKIVQNDLNENHLVKKKWQNLVEIEGQDNNGPAIQRWAYYPPREAAVLNSFQSLAAVDRRTYRLCCPLLWERLHFPSLLPIHMSFWLHDLLPRQGSYVRSLEVELSPDWLKESPSFPEPSRATHPYSLRSSSSQVANNRAGRHPLSARDRDNLSLHSIRGSRRSENHWSLDYRPPKPLSPESLHAVLLHCPNIRILKFKAPFKPHGSSAPNISKSFQSRLLSLLLSLPQLQKLDISCHAPYDFGYGSMSQALAGLPMLESLYYHIIPEDQNDEVGTRAFVTRISELKHLRFLSLESYPATLLSHPCRSLTGLDVSGCARHTLGQSSTQLDISQFAPNITWLALFMMKCGKGDWNADICLGSNTNTQRYQFPWLKKLIVMYFHPSSDLIIRFQACKRIELISWDVEPPLDFTPIIDLVCSSTWPMLKTLRLTGVYNRAHPEAVTHAASIERLPKLLDFCRANGIELTVE